MTPDETLMSVLSPYILAHADQECQCDDPICEDARTDSYLTIRNAVTAALRECRREALKEAIEIASSHGDYDVAAAILALAEARET